MCLLYLYGLMAGRASAAVEKRLAAPGRTDVVMWSEPERSGPRASAAGGAGPVGAAVGATAAGGEE